MARRYVVMSADDCPPDDQPWLISSRGELARDKQKIGAMAKDMQEAHPFPPPSSYVKMLQWAESVEEAMHDDFIWGMETHVTPAICFEHAPQSMELQLLVNRADVVDILKHANSTKFLQSSYLRKVGHEERLGLRCLGVKGGRGNGDLTDVPRAPSCNQAGAMPRREHAVCQN
jgi:hypothetical protein